VKIAGPFIEEKLATREYSDSVGPFASPAVHETNTYRH
jgi:hypothetical protein